VNKKYVIAFAVILMAIIAALIIQSRTTSEPLPLGRGFVFDKSSGIKLKDIETYYHHVDFNEENAGDYFKDKIVNPYTIKFFIFLDDHFKEFENEKDLFENVHRYLSSIMPDQTADPLFDLFKKFVHYQSTLDEKTKVWGMPKTTEEAIVFLHKLQDYRRGYFGKDIADVLFGPGVKAEEYPLRRGAILNDKNTYGGGKEKKLKKLNEDMWGEEADQVDAGAEPYFKYREKLAMYEKDLSEMDEEGKQAKIRTRKEAMLTSEQIKKLEEVERAPEPSRTR
jgi:hypothetical protein